MNEAETRAELIDPALKAIGWGMVEASRISREAIITKGRQLGAGKRAAGDIADYCLPCRNHKLAVIEGCAAAHQQTLHQAEPAGTPSPDIQRGRSPTSSKILVITGDGPGFQANQ
jgi:type I restriction enzyme R subunit